MDELERAAQFGLITVQETREGWRVFGARGDLLLEGELEAVGAVWRSDLEAYIIPRTGGEVEKQAKRLHRNATKAAAALAARRTLAQENGVKLFDQERAKAQRKVTRDIKATYSQALAEHAAEIKALKEFEKFADPVEALDLANKRGELEAVYDELAKGLAMAGQSAAAVTGGQLPAARTATRNIMAWQVDNLACMNVSRMVGDNFAALAATGVTSYHGKYDLKAWEGVADRVKARRTIKEAVTRGVLTGEHPTKIAERIEGIYTGAEAGSPYLRAVRIARTETNRVMNEAALEYMHDLEASGVLVRKRWSATLDGSTRDDHRKVDGEAVPLDEKFSNGLRRPGDGGAADSINCRCCLVTELDGFTPKARRDNLRGVSIPYQSYETWEKNGGLRVSQD